MKKITLYIPCFNAEKTIKECLDSVTKQTYPIDEILIINDACQDRTPDIISEYPVKVIRHGKNKGLAASRNTAFRLAKNEFVASLDADCVAYPEWLEQLMLSFSDDNIAGAGGMLIDRYFSSVADQWRRVHMKQDWGEKYLKDAPFLYGNNSVFRKNMLNLIGFYNDCDFKNYYEDIDISNRLHQKDYRLVYNPAAKVEHLRVDTINSVLKTYWGWSYYAHVTPHNVKHTLRRVVARLLLIVEIFHNFFEIDLAKKNLKLLVPDLLLPFYFLWLDLNSALNKIIKIKQDN